MKKTSASLLLVALLLSACSLGDGNKPLSIRFVKSTSDTGTLASQNVYECFTQSVIVLADFTDGIPGDFTPRATFSTNRPDIVKVSNGDLPVAGHDNLVYTRGVLVPVGEGEAIIKAEFAGLTAELTVKVHRPVSLTVTNEQMTDSNGVTRHDIVAMVPGSIQQLVATAVLDAEDGTDPATVNVSSLGEWVLDADSAIATVGTATGIVAALDVPAGGEPVKATISFPACADNPPSVADGFDYDTQFLIKTPARNLVVVTEPGYPAEGGRVAAGSIQFPRVLADFDTDAANGEGQDLTFKGVKFTSDPATAFSYSSLSATLIAGATPTTVGVPAALVAKFGPDTNPYVSNALHLNIVTATLDRIDIQEGQDTPVSVEALGNTRFTVKGTFTVSGETEKLIQPVSHDVRWTTSNTAVAVASNFAVNAGTVFSVKDEASTEDITVTAESLGLIPKTDTTAETVSDTAKLKVIKTP